MNLLSTIPNCRNQCKIVNKHILDMAKFLVGFNPLDTIGRSIYICLYQISYYKQYINDNNKWNRYEKYLVVKQCGVVYNSIPAMQWNLGKIPYIQLFETFCFCTRNKLLWRIFYFQEICEIVYNHILAMLFTSSVYFFSESGRFYFPFLHTKFNC